MTAPLFGFINAFKPPGPSSAAFGNWVKRIAEGATVGHWGTLDPGACGVLPLAVGKASKLIPLLPSGRKQYVFEFVAGEQTDTGDAFGMVVASAPAAPGWQRDLADAARAMIGPQEQLPPMHSAIKVEGRPLYKSARRGLDVPRTPRTITIYALRILDDHAKPADQSRARKARIFVDCDAGTYIRVLCEDLGRRIGIPARMGALLRAGAGPFVLHTSVSPEQIEKNLMSCLLNPLSVLANPRLEIDSAAARSFIHGNQVQLKADGVTGLPLDQPAHEVLVLHADVLLGSAHAFQSADSLRLAPTRVFVNEV